MSISVFLGTDNICRFMLLTMAKHAKIGKLLFGWANWLVCVIKGLSLYRANL